MKRMESKYKKLCVVIYHTETIKVTDLNMVINDPGRVVEDGNLLALINKLLDEVWEMGYDFELIGGDDNDD